MKVHLLTSFACFDEVRGYGQSLAAYSFSRVEDVEVVVLGNDPGGEDVCRKYGFRQVKNLPIGKDVGVDGSNGIVIGEAFARMQSLLDGDILIYISSDCVLSPSFFGTDVSMVEGLRLLANATANDFGCVGRRLNLDSFKFSYDVEDDYRRVLDNYRNGVLNAERTPYGIDFCIWSRPCFERIPKLPFVIDGWYWDVWIGSSLLDATSNVFLTDGVIDVFHVPHRNSSIHQQLEHRPSSEYNAAILNSWKSGIRIQNLQFQKSLRSISNEGMERSLQSV